MATDTKKVRPRKQTEDRQQDKPKKQKKADGDRLRDAVTLAISDAAIAMAEALSRKQDADDAYLAKTISPYVTDVIDLCAGTKDPRRYMAQDSNDPENRT